MNATAVGAQTKRPGLPLDQLPLADGVDSKLEAEARVTGSCSHG